MKFAFFGTNGATNYYKIGGAESIIRRLSYEVSSNVLGSTVYILSYGERKYSKSSIDNGIVLIKFKNFLSLLKFLKSERINYALTFNLHKLDYFHLKRFLSSHKEIEVSCYLLSFHPSIIKRTLSNILISYSFNAGRIFCASPRIFSSVSKITNNVELILPPVNDDFFTHKKLVVSPQKKCRIAYMGRLDKGKGAGVAMNYFANSMLDESKYEFFIYGYPWKSDPYSMRLHEELKSQSKIRYVETKKDIDIRKIGSFLAELIDNVDIFFLPYKYVHSTIDSPLVPLEILARGKVFLISSLDELEHIVPHKLMQLDIGNSTVSRIDKRIQKLRSESITIAESILSLKNSLDYKASRILSKIVKDL